MLSIMESTIQVLILDEALCVHANLNPSVFPQLLDSLGKATSLREGKLQIQTRSTLLKN